MWDAWTRAHGISMWTEVTPTQTLLYLQWLRKWLQATTNSTLTQLQPLSTLQYHPDTLRATAPEAERRQAGPRDQRARTSTHCISRAKRHKLYRACHVALNCTVLLREQVHTALHPLRYQSTLTEEHILGAWPTLEQYAHARDHTMAMWIPRSWEWRPEYQDMVCDIQRTLAHCHNTRVIVLAPQQWWEDEQQLKVLCRPQEFDITTHVHPYTPHVALPLAPGTTPQNMQMTMYSLHTAHARPIHYGLISNHVGHAVFAWGMHMLYPDHSLEIDRTPASDSREWDAAF